jgi:hypothetical protein
MKLKIKGAANLQITRNYIQHAISCVRLNGMAGFNYVKCKTILQ